MVLDSRKGRELGQRDGAGGLLAQPAGQAHHGQPKLAGKAAILLAAALPAFEERDFVWFWFGALISNVGTWMQLITVPYVILKLTGSGAWVGLTAFAGLFPAVVASPIAGSLADRFERRTLLLWSQVAQMLLALALWGLWEGGLRRPILLVLLVAANGVF